MKLVMTLAVRDEADIVEANLVYHLERGVDAFLALDDHSQDGTTDILEQYRREGHLHLFSGTDRGGLHQGEILTEMARFAASHLGADWVICNDADEFWWSEHETLKDALAEVPDRYGSVVAPRVEFVPRPGGDGFFADRMVVRRAAPGADLQNEALSPAGATKDGKVQADVANRLLPKSAHRAHPQVVVRHGNHASRFPGCRVLRGWHPIVVMHFPIRSYSQWERKMRNGAEVASKGYYYRNWEQWRSESTEALREGRLPDLYRRLALDDREVEAGIREGSLVVDRSLQRFFECSARQPETMRAARDTRSEQSRWRSAELPGSVQDSLASLRYARILCSIDETERYIDARERKLASPLERRIAKLKRRVEKAERRRQAAERRLGELERARWVSVGRSISSLTRHVQPRRRRSDLPREARRDPT